MILVYYCMMMLYFLVKLLLEIFITIDSEF